MKKTGSVKSGSKGADNTAAAAMTLKIMGKKMAEIKRINIVDLRRCFLSCHDVMSMAKTKYSLLQNWYRRSRTRPAMSSRRGVPSL